MVKPHLVMGCAVRELLNVMKDDSIERRKPIESSALLKSTALSFKEKQRALKKFNIGQVEKGRKCARKIQRRKWCR